MSYIGVKINSLIEKVAGMPLMDVAFSSTSTNGVQNKVIKAKFDEVDGRLDDLNDNTAVTLYTGTVTVGDTIELLENINNFKHIWLIINSLQGEATIMVNPFKGNTSRTPVLIASIVAFNSDVSPAVMCLGDLALVGTDLTHYNIVRSAQCNLTSNGVSYLSGSQSFQITISASRS